jgi:hypothetical protein
MRTRYYLIVCGTIKDLQLAKGAKRVPAQVTGIQRVTIENNYLHS